LHHNNLERILTCQIWDDLSRQLNNNCNKLKYKEESRKPCIHIGSENKGVNKVGDKNIILTTNSRSKDKCRIITIKNY
jgi:hypothetical protein